MPPEPLPWDRKDFFKERKHERSESGARWRDSPSSMPYHHGSRELARWGSGDFRRPPGHGKQGGWHQFGGDSGHGYSPLRSAERMWEMEGCRSFSPNGDGRYFRNSVRDNRGSYSQRDWKGHASETCSVSPNTSGRLDNLNNEQRSNDDMLTYPPRAHSEFANTCNQPHPKDQNDDKACAGNGLGTGLRCEGENSVGSTDLKPVKWSRSGSLSSRGSGFSHSSSSKSLGGVDSSEGKTEFHHKNTKIVQSPSADPATCVSPAGPSDEMTSRKKQRLGWGEGLAKYEKKRVEPDTSTDGGGTTISACNSEPNNSMALNLADKSPRLLSLSDCASPATPSSVACSSSPGGTEDKSFDKVANRNNDVNELCSPPSLVSQNHLERFSFNLENVDANSIANLRSSLNDLLQPEDLSSVDSSFVRSTAMNKLLLWRGDILKVLEMTESEIDSLENELKSLKCESRERCPSLAMSSPFSLDGNSKPCEQEALSSLIPRPSPLQIDQSGDAVLGTNSVGGIVEVVCADAKDEDVESPGSATSKFTEPLSVGKAVSPSDNVKGSEYSRDFSVLKSTKLDLCVPSGCTIIGTDVSVCKDDAQITTSTSCGGIGENISYDLILSTNKELAKSASEVFNNLLLKDHCPIELAGVLSNVAGSKCDTFLREKFSMRKRDLRLKEKILTLKYRALHHMWKEERMLSVRKYRAKSQKKFEVTLRPTHGVYQKHRSIRSRFSSPAGSLSLVPTMEGINFVSKLLSEAQVKHQRDCLKMPTLILDEKEKQHSRFVSNNGLVEDPCAVEKERSLTNPWSAEETDIFLDKLATFGKDFNKIASFLDHKTTADCVQFYYKNHKSDCFEKTKKKLNPSKNGKLAASSTYLVTSSKKWSRERNAASLDILGAASVMAAHAESRIGNRQMSSGRIFLGACSESKSSKVEDTISERSNSFDFTGNDREAAAADVLAGICGSMSSEAMSSCITSSVDRGSSEWKCQKVDSVMKWTSASDVTENVDDDTCSDDSCGELNAANWTDEEKSLFVQAYSCHGKDFARISKCVKTRSEDQCRIFFSKARKCFGLDSINPSAQNTGKFTCDCTNGDGSDMEDTCGPESSACQQGSKVNEDLPASVTINKDEPDPAETLKLQTDLNIPEDNNLDQSNSEAVESIISDGRPAQDTDVGKDQTADQCGAITATSVGEVLDASPCNLTSEIKPRSIPNGRDEKCGSKVTIQGFSFSPQVLQPVSLESDSAGNHSFAACNNQDRMSSTQEFPDRGDMVSNQDRMSSTHATEISMLPISIKEGINGGTSCKQQSEAQSVPNKDRIANGQFLSQDYYLKKCNGSKSQSQSSVSALPWSQNLGQPSARPRSHARSLSDTEKPSRNGNVKLFGQILSSSGDESDKGAKSSNAKLNGAKLNGHHHVEGSQNPNVLKFDRHNYHGLENVPMSFGFWDGNRIQTGFSSLPDSSVLMAKYPTAFANYPAATSKMVQQQAMPTARKTNVQTINGTTVFPSMDITNNGVVDYHQVYRNHVGSNIQPFSLDMKPKPEMQIRNGFDPVPSLQQQGKGMIGLNHVGRPGVLVNGTGTGVQDPVAALQLYASQNGSMIQEEETWRGKGDISR